MWLLGLSLSSLSFIGSGCDSIEIKDKVTCSVSGSLARGATCTHTLTGDISYKSFEEYLDWLEAKPERPDPSHPGALLPAHGAALAMSSKDWGEFKTELEIACRLLKNRCSYEMKQAIVNLEKILQNQSSFQPPTSSIDPPQ